MEEKTAQELADMISSEINVGGVFVKVHADPAQGWKPTVMTGPGNTIPIQAAADNIAQRLRQKYALKK